MRVCVKQRSASTPVPKHKCFLKGQVHSFSTQVTICTLEQVFLAVPEVLVSVTRSLLNSLLVVVKGPSLTLRYKYT